MDEPGGEAPALRDVLGRLMAAHQAEMADRALTLRLDLDASWAPPVSGAFEAALRVLFRLVFATVPDGCAVDFSGARSPERVSDTEAGRWAARWQVASPPTRAAGSAGAPQRDGPIPIHPRPGAAEVQLRSALARATQAAFARSDWVFGLEALEDGRELLAWGERE